MSITYGLSATGLLVKTQDICRNEISNAVKAKRGLSYDTSDGSAVGVFIGILSEREGSIWALCQAIYNATDPDGATGASLDGLSALTGTVRANARSSTVQETLTGVPATVVPSQSQIKTASTGNIFATNSSATIAGPLPNWVGSTPYVASQRITNAGNAYQCAIGGTSGITGPSSTSYAIVDGTVTWRFLGAGTGAVDVQALSLTKDAIVAVSGDLTAINTPVSGWNGASNVLDAVVGAVVQPDALLRLTREAELSQDGSGTPDALRAAILAVTGVTACTVYHNDTDFVDANGQAAHSVQALVQGGDDTAIATVLYENVSAGIVTTSSGGTPVAIVIPDSQGVNHTFTFSRPAVVTIYVDITLSYNPATVANGGYTGDTFVQAAIATQGNLLPSGNNVVASAVSADAFPLFFQGSLVAGVQGVLDVTLVKIGTAPSPTLSTTIVITPFQLAQFDTSRVTVHSTPGSV